MNYHSYFFVKQLVFIVAFAICGTMVMFSLLGISTIVLEAFVERNPSDDLSGLGEALIAIFLSSAISIVIGIAAGAIISANYTVHKYRLVEKDPEFSVKKYTWKCMQPYFLAVLGSILLICMLAAASVNKAQVYMAVCTLEIPIVVYLADKNLFGKYFEMDVK